MPAHPRQKYSKAQFIYNYTDCETWHDYRWQNVADSKRQFHSLILSNGFVIETTVPETLKHPEEQTQDGPVIDNGSHTCRRDSRVRVWMNNQTESPEITAIFKSCQTQEILPLHWMLVIKKLSYFYSLCKQLKLW